MQKIYIPVILILLISLAACGKNSAASEQPIEAQTDTPASAEVNNDSDALPDISQILTNQDESSFIISELSEEQKQKIVEQGKKDGLEITFGDDGSTTILNVEKGNVSIQKADGSWKYEESTGSQGQIGGEWPDNELTRLVPEPNFEISQATLVGSEFNAIFNNVTLDQMRDYSEQIKNKGFTEEAQTQDYEFEGAPIFTYTAKNAEGYGISLTWTDSLSAMGITFSN